MEKKKRKSSTKKKTQNASVARPKKTKTLKLPLSKLKSITIYLSNSTIVPSNEPSQEPAHSEQTGYCQSWKHYKSKITTCFVLW